MRTADLFKNRTVLSFEVFPPKRTSSIDTVYKTLNELRDLSPDFISVTYGAGGSANSQLSVDIASAIKNKCGIESVAHLPCISLTKQDVLDYLKKLSEHGIENILALRGDLPSEDCTVGDFKYANELIAFIKENGDFNITAACYPEGHIECKSLDEDLDHLKNKVNCGADHLISQLFFDNSCFYSFRERCAQKNINAPIEAGIMPVTNKKQIERMVSLCGATLPKKFVYMMSKYENSPEAIRDAGIAYAVDQIVDLVTQGVDGIHLYTMNNPYVAGRICEATRSLFAVSSSNLT